ncbi:unnamed protein product [Knipowitschia caucasica]
MLPRFTRATAKARQRTSGSAASSTRLVWSEGAMAEAEEDGGSAPEFQSLLQMDPYLKPYEKDFKRR